LTEPSRDVAAFDSVSLETFDLPPSLPPSLDVLDLDDVRFVVVSLFSAGLEDGLVLDLDFDLDLELEDRLLDSPDS